MEVATSTPPSRGHREGSHEHVCETLRRGPETRSELHQDSPVAQPHALRELRSRGSKTQTFRTGRVPTTSRASATCGGGLGDYVFVLTFQEAIHPRDSKLEKEKRLYDQKQKPKKVPLPLAPQPSTSSCPEGARQRFCARVKPPLPSLVTNRSVPFTPEEPLSGLFDVDMFQ